MAARLLEKPDRPPRPNSHDMGRYSEDLLKTIWDGPKAEALFKRAVQIVEGVAGGNFDRDHVRTQPFTEKVQKRCLAQTVKPPKTSATGSAKAPAVKRQRTPAAKRK